MYGGRVYEFTHWDPKSNMVWADDIPNGPKLPDGKWVNTESVKWIDQEVKR